MSPTQRSLAHLKKAGYKVAIVEHFNQFARIRQDLFGFADLLAFRPGVPCMLVQTTTASNAAARRKKILANGTAKLWALCGYEVVLHSWGLRGPRGQRKTWTVEPEWLTEDQFAKEAP